MAIQGNLNGLVYSNNLDIKKFEALISNNTQGYKFYWLEAIIRLLATGKDEFSFDELLNEMIWEAWRTVTYFHLRLGPSIMGKEENYLEHAINTLNKIQAQSSLDDENHSHEKVLNLIKSHEDSIKQDKNSLTRYVPFRLIKPFVDGEGKKYIEKAQNSRFIAYLNEFCKLNYKWFYNIYDADNPLNRKIILNPVWSAFILDNYDVIMGWIQFHKAEYIQSRNPLVPGIIYKISPDYIYIRKLQDARELWKLIVCCTGAPLYEIYTGKELSLNNFSLDHFIPRSYTANDELWNLIPMSKSLNSSKNNKLPDWEKYFNRFADYQYYMYSVIFNHHNNSEKLLNQYEKCKSKNVNSIWALEKLYVDGNSEHAFKDLLRENLESLYKSAELQGYEKWEC